MAMYGGMGSMEVAKQSPPHQIGLAHPAPPDATPALAALDRLASLVQRAANLAVIAAQIKDAIHGPQPQESNVKDIGAPPEPAGLVPMLHARLGVLDTWLTKAERELNAIARM